jgi:hypothetical protein
VLPEMSVKEILPETCQTISSQLDDFAKCYHSLGIKLPKVIAPAKRPEFDRLIVVAKGVSSQVLFENCKKLFPCWKWEDKDLDRVVTSNDRVAACSYAIWVRDRVKADEELSNRSAMDLGNARVQSVTLCERLIYELKYFYETGQHLDVEATVTLCSGCRYYNGLIPSVCWQSRGLRIGWYSCNDAFTCLRGRQVQI